jgi:hypothetical protein
LDQNICIKEQSLTLLTLALKMKQNVLSKHHTE